MVKKTATVEDPVHSELIDIKRLLVLKLLRDGATQSEIAAALGVGQSSISRMFPKVIGSVTKGLKNAKR